MSATMKIKLPTQAQILASTGGAPAEWAGCCHQVSSAVADLIGEEHAVVRRGYFLGPVAPDSYFGRLGGVSQHSWVELRDGRVLDPTRFAIVGGKPWPLWVGPDDEYDIGGCKRAAPAGRAPHLCESAGEPIELKIESAGYVADLLGASSFDFSEEEGDSYVMVSREQAAWLANLPVKDREGAGVLSRMFAAEVYEALMDCGMSALIPIDRRDWILPERSDGRSAF